MDVFLLGAGRPATGQVPSALKRIAPDTRAMDWQIRSFRSVNESARLHYLGGYHVQEVIQQYPELNFTVIPDWDKQSILHTLLKAPFSKAAALVAYSDTVFRQEMIKQLTQCESDFVFCVDTSWRQRYTSRSQQDIEKAETISLEKFGLQQDTAEFTGLVYFSPAVVEHLSVIDESSVGHSLVDLLTYLQEAGFVGEAKDVVGDWAEFNSPDDIAHFILGSKAETLERLRPVVSLSHIGHQIAFTVEEWERDSKDIVSEIQEVFRGNHLIVRSSAKAEDNWEFSNAGGFTSQLNVDAANTKDISKAVEAVTESYATDKHQQDQILVQKCVRDVSFSGVAFTCNLVTGAPYYHFNFDDKNNSTESVTAGKSNDLRQVVVSQKKPELLETVEPKLVPVLKAVQELEGLLSFGKLDIEFAIDSKNIIHIFQVRPITVDHSCYEIENEALWQSLRDNVQHFRAQQTPSPFVVGERSIFGNMPDWNPAEIIGTKPKPLAFSLYRKLISNEVWAIQRQEFGYRDVRPSPLIIGFSGQPYVDVRASLNSFIPAELPDSLAAKLVQSYLTALLQNPEYHDKVEFEVALTIWTPGFQQELIDKQLIRNLEQADISKFEAALKLITRNAITRLQQDTALIDVLCQRRGWIEASDMSALDKMMALLNDCRQYGTLAFSHAARAGFVATTMLKSFVKTGILTENRRLDFMRSLQTVARNFEKDKWLQSQGNLSRDQLLSSYGHLRPGTYEIGVPAYWEDPDFYIFNSKALRPVDPGSFQLTTEEAEKILQMLQELGAETTVSALMDYFREAIEAREKVKFEFTRNLSLALDACVLLAKELSLSRDEMAYAEYDDLEQLRLNVIDVNIFKDRILQRKNAYALVQSVELPSLITVENEFYCFERHASRPNFITHNKATADVAVLANFKPAELEGKIILIPQADPGFDWLFGYNIAGLITKYGGANSHMSIRAAEVGLPAAIGVGDKLYEDFSKMKRVMLDCAKGVIQEVL